MTASMLPLCYHTILMAEKRNNFIDDVGLSESTSLTHDLLDGGNDADNTGLDFIKHSPYSMYSNIMICHYDLPQVKY